MTSSKNKPSTVTMGLCTVIVGMFGFMGTLVKTFTEEKALLTNQIADLQNKINTLSEEILKQRDKSYFLEMQLSKELTEKKVLQALLDSVPLPMWVKEKFGSVFTMLMINNAYTRAFNKTKFEYVGRTDFDVYSEDIAKEFQKHDLEVYTSKKFLCVKEKVNKPKKVLVCKFPIMLDGTRFGVGGIVLDNTLF